MNFTCIKVSHVIDVNESLFWEHVKTLGSRFYQTHFFAWDSGENHDNNLLFSQTQIQFIQQHDMV